MEAAVNVKLIIVFISFLSTSSVRGDTNYEYVTVSVKVQKYQCSPYSYQKCTSVLWGVFKSCKTITEQRCSYVTVNEDRTIRRCKAGWAEPDCIIPICSPACTNGKTCISPNNCGCLRTGTGACSTVSCSSTLDCYPGTCSANGISCQCPTGFGGSNCDQFQVTPKISSCRATLYASSPEIEIANSPCYADNVTPIPVWVRLPPGSNSFSSISVNWDAEVDGYYYAMPAVSYVTPSPFQMGMTAAQCRVSVSDVPSQVFSGQCGIYDVDSTWVGKKSCSFRSSWTTFGTGNPTHNQTITFTAMSTSGGWKTVNIQGATKKQITGLTASMTAQFKVDSSPPTHCLLRQANGDGCDCFPIYLAKDITSSNVIRPIMCGWSDDGSGLDRFEVDVFYLNSGVDGRLTETGQRLPISEDNVSPLNNDYYFTLQKSGVYSIQLTVFDKANNSARARKILNYDGDSKWTVNENAKVYVAEASESTGYRWINALEKPRTGDYLLTLRWTGRYKSDVRYNSAWMGEVVAWTGCTTNNYCIDDRPPTAYKGPQQPVYFGLRTTAALPDSSGILGYGLSYVVDAQGGRGLTNPTQYNYINSSADSTTITVPVQDFTDGKTLVVWFTASDVAGNEESLRLLVGLDRTSANVSSAEFKQNSFDQYKWSLTVAAVDIESGIASVSYVIHDASFKVNVTSGSNDFEAVDEQQCGSNCYCVSAGGCFSYSLQVDVDNCNFDKYISDPLLMWYTVTNGAGLKITRKLELSNLDDVRCRPLPTLTPGAIVGIVIGCVVFVLLVILIALLIWRWIVHKDPLPPKARKFYNQTFRRRGDENAAYASPSEFQTVSVGLPNPTNSKPKTAVTASYDEEYGTSENVNCRVMTAKDVTVDAMLAEGKFAVVRKGTARIDSNSPKVAVAIKALKRGFTPSDRQLMTQKIEFLASIAPHVNIVQLIGSYDGGNDGPVMVLELCEIPLSNYLDRIDGAELSADNLEDMLTFVLNIATGVQYLHSKNIVHRRLGVRNVLLKQQLSGYVAKLIGFGPSAAEEGGLPLRWLPLETHDTQKSSAPTFNTQTDAWTFGITVWEIYSKGSKPYPRNKVGEVHGLLKRGYRMERPEYCPNELWNQVVIPCWNNTPLSRPSFKAICNTITQFRNSNAVQENYYTADQLGEGEVYCNM